MKTAVIVPALNEEKTIVGVIKNIAKHISLQNIIVVDDGSKDQTYNNANGTGCKVLKQIINLGKGAALKTGCDFAISKGAQKLILIDSDGQHNPKYIPQIEKELDKKDIIFTYRTFDKKMPLVFRVGNSVIKKGFLGYMKLKDPLCGYKGITQEAYKKVRWTSSGYFVESEIAYNTKQRELSFAEIPIETIYGDDYKGTTVFDGINIFLNIIWWRIAKKK